MVRYCSDECQKSHWDETHKAFCRDICGLNAIRSGAQQLRFTDSAAISGPDFRFLTYQVARDFLALLQRRYTQGDGLGPGVAAFIEGPPPNQLLLLRYDDEKCGGQMSVQLWPLDNASIDEAFVREFPLLDMSRVWRGSWKRTESAEVLGYPVLVLLPEGPYPQSMTAYLTRTTNPGLGVHVRWLHCA